jgi:protein O-mannosyl-transferase
MTRLATTGLMAATVLAYLTAFPGAFQFDDWNVVVRNADVHGMAAWLASMPGIRPLTKATYALNWSLDPSPAGFVAFNVACHALCAVLVLALARRWLTDFAPGARVDMAALAAALAFALHPAQTEAVTYIAGRSVSLAALFYLGSLYAWERGRTGRRSRWCLSSVGLFVAAMAARETAWTLPFAVALVEIARGARPVEAARRARWYFAALTVVLVVIAASPTYRRLLETSFAIRGPLENLAAQLQGVAYLVTHPLLTLRLNVDPDLTAASGNASSLVHAAALLALIAIGCGQLRARPWIGFGVLWFFLHLAPTNGLVARLDLANDRQLYLALLGPALVAGVALGRLRPAATGAIVTALGLGLCLATLARNTDYRSEVALWEATARVSPGKARVWNNLGYAYLQSGEREPARAAFERAVALDPAHYKAMQNLQDLRAH